MQSQYASPVIFSSLRITDHWKICSVFICPLTEVTELGDGPPSSLFMEAETGENSDRKNYSLKKSNDCDQYNEANSAVLLLLTL